MQTNLNRNISRFLLLSVAVYFVAAWYVGWEEIYAALSKVDPTVVLWPLAFSLTAYVLRFARWQYYLHIFNKPVRWRTSLLIYFTGFALAMTPGKVGELLRCAYLKPHGISYRRSSAMFVVEKLLDIVAMLALASLAFSYFSDKLDFLYLILAVVLLALVLLVNPRMALLMRRRLSAVGSKAGRLLRHGLDVLLHTGRILKPLPMLAGLSLGIAAWFMDGAGFYYISSYFVPQLSLATVIGVYALSILLGAFSFMPGGVGATEALMYGFLHLLGVPAEQAVVVIILSRLTTIWFAVLLGALSVFALGKASRASKPTA